MIKGIIESQEVLINTENGPLKTTLKEAYKANGAGMRQDKTKADKKAAEKSDNN